MTDENVRPNRGKHAAGILLGLATPLLAAGAVWAVFWYAIAFLASPVEPWPLWLRVIPAIAAAFGFTQTVTGMVRYTVNRQRQQQQAALLSAMQGGEEDVSQSRGPVSGMAPGQRWTNPGGARK